MDIGIDKRLSLLIERLNLNPNSFAESIQMVPTTIYNVVGGRKTKPSFDLLLAIKDRYPEVDINWLINGSGESPFVETPRDITIQPTRSSDLKTIPLVSLKAAANALMGIEKSESVESMDTIKLPGWMLHPGTHIAIQIRGLSMHPVITDGSVAIIRRMEEWGNFKQGRIHMIYSDVYGAQLKYLRRSERNSQMILMESENAEENPTISISASEVNQVWEVELCLNFKFISQRKQVLERVNLLETGYIELALEVDKLKSRING